jgi:DNA polymerase I-like protein with 3'-5' exonuclease and polymerase domains
MSSPRLCILVEDIEEGSRLLHWLKKNILQQAGMSEGDYILGDVTKSGTISDTLPLLLMCKSVKEDKLMPEYLGIKSIADHHGHIQWKRGRLIGITFHPQAALGNPNLLPLIIREIGNLLQAAEKPFLLDRPPVSKGYVLPYKQGKEVVCDLEWNIATNKTTVVGIAYSSAEAHSTYNTDDALGTVRKHIQAGTRISGHNIVEADLPRIGEPKSWGPDHVFDTRIVAHLIHAHLAETGHLDLGSICRLYFPTSEWKLDKTDLLGYNGLDCAYNYRLADALKRDLTVTEQWHLVEKQQRLARMCYEMQQIGISLDQEGLWKYAKQREQDKITAKGRFGFNPNSSQQITSWLLAEFGIKVKDTAYETLAKHSGKHPKLDDLITYRDDNKSLSTWFPLEYSGKGKKKVLSQVGDIIHPHHNTTGTAVDRFSCADPNVQNLPPNLRQFLIPPEGHDFWVMDKCQLENRTVAWAAEDWEALKAWDTEDPYTVTAAVMFGKTYSEIAADAKYWKQQNAKKNSFRERGKTTELASIYGETHYNLANRLFGNQKKDSVIEAQRLQELYFARRPKVRAWQLRMEAKFGKGDVMLRNAFGRVRFCYATNAHEFKKRACHFFGCSNGAGHVNQLALDIKDQLGLLPGMVVHDDWSGWLPKGEEGLRLARQIKEIMEQPIKEMPLPGGGYLRIPIEAKCGSNYRDVQEVLL